MNLPVVAIVGRPNVGKSSLLNCFAERRIAIVDEVPGVTRDRVSTILSHEDVTMEVVDTGGIGIVDRDDLGEHVERQVEQAIRGANVILLLTDVRDGITPLDREVARRLRERAQEIPVFLVVNKVDTGDLHGEVPAFYALGMGDPVPISALHRYGTLDLLDQVVQKLWPTGEVELDPVMRLAVVGRQNVGKSTLVNSIAREERTIVSEVPGTTRDAVDIHFEKDGHRFVVIDTAGVQRLSRARTRVEVYSQLRTEAAVRRADVVLFLLDASHDVTRADKRLGEFIAKESRPSILVANKWDLTGGKMTTGEYGDYLYECLPRLRYAPVVFTTALEAKNIQSALDLAQNLFKRARRRVGTGELNRALRAITEHHRPRSRGKRVPRVFYATQVAVCPPTIVVFVNNPAFFPPDYLRYLEGAFREALDFDELPVRLLLRGRSREEPAEGVTPRRR